MIFVKKTNLILPLLVVLFSLSFNSKVYADSVQEWFTTEPLPYKIASHTSFSAGGKVSVVGGSSVTGQSKFDVKTSTPSANGALESWVTTSLVPNALIWHTTSLTNNNVYVLGGKEENPGSAGTEVNKVYRGELNTNGEVVSWQILNPMPGTRALGNSVIVNDRIYYAGGFNSSGRHDEIYYADINPDGTLGAWTTSTISLPTALYGFSMLEHGGNIYVLGGNNASNLSQNKVYKSTVNPDGTLTSWIELNSLPLTNYRGHALVANDRIIMAGGEHGAGAFVNKVFYTGINPDGSLSEWQESANSLPVPISSGAMSRVGDYLYITGGLTTGYNYLDSVYYTKIDDSVNLDVELYKQNDPLWGEDLYDSANLWATGEQDMTTWGCAVTSAAMVFNYHGLDEISSGTPLTPSSLNTWLKSQSDGYIGKGLVNWVALSRLSRQISNLNDAGFNELEIIKIVTSDHQTVKNNIDLGNPDILKVSKVGVPMHFVVAKGYGDSAININDPFSLVNDLTEYENTFADITRVTPSDSDISYIMLVVDEGVIIELFDQDGIKVGQVIVEEPITDPSGLSSTTALPLKVLYYPKPSSGEYKVKISSPLPSKYSLQAYLYDVEGNVAQFSFEDEVSEDANIYNINFDKENNESSGMFENVTYETFIKDIKKLYENGEIKNHGLYRSLVERLKQAQLSGKNEKKQLEILRSWVLQRVKVNQFTINAGEQIAKKIDVLISSL